ncbi:MAG: 50S ribosomal protein L33 [Patescibacteria group bacterium]
MAWQKSKILLISVEQDPKTGKKVVHRYVVTKSKGKGKPQQGKLTLKKYNPILRKHVLYTESKYK